MREARFEKMRSNLQDSIIEKDGVVRTSNDTMVSFKLLYGFNSEQEASAQARGKQILPLEIKRF